MSGLSWAKLLSERRLPKKPVGDAFERSGRSADEDIPSWIVPSRTETERDFDRVLFATPTRRLGDKTQVFPLEKNESVRTRLTHSHEVANLARSIGTYLVSGSTGERILQDACPAADTEARARVRRAIPAMLAAAGLAHDLGNPPFGHQGEEAIRSWIRLNDARIFRVASAAQSDCDEESGIKKADLESLSERHRADFRHFEGNAQTLRTVARLQVVRDDRGLNLTFGTLAALMKYTVGSSGVSRDGPASSKKFGFFESERPLVALIHEETGLREGLRHPLTYIMEACDDIAYSVIDAEDAVKKQIVSFSDLVAYLRARCGDPGDEVTLWVLSKADSESEAARAAGLPPAEINDVSMQMFRVFAINAMMSSVMRAFEENYDRIMLGTFDKPLVDISRAAGFCDVLKRFDFEHAYKHRRVLEIELDGYNTIHGLMNMLWRGITERESYEDLSSKRTSPFARYAYGRISENYRRVFEGRLQCTVYDDGCQPIRYRELQLLTDMISGMTDQFAVDLYQDLRAFHVDASTCQR